jgi:hypothetical protein
MYLDLRNPGAFAEHADKEGLATAQRVRLEQRLARRLVKRLLAAGLALSIYDGEEWALTRSRDLDAIWGALGETDSDLIRAYDSQGEHVGFVTLIWGNGEDLLSDWTDGGVVDGIARDLVGLEA